MKVEEAQEAPVPVVDEEGKGVSAPPQEDSTARNGRRKFSIIILALIVVLVLGLALGLGIGLTRDEDEDEVESMFTRSSSYIREVCSDESLRDLCVKECKPAECCKLHPLDRNETCLSNSKTLGSCVAYSACHVVLYSDGGANGLEDAAHRIILETDGLEDLEPPTTTVAPFDLYDTCSPESLASNHTACEDVCEIATCCMPNNYADCQASHFLKCLDYASCQNLDQIATDRLLPAPPNLDELCLSDEESDRDQCEALCLKAACCESDGEEGCFESDFLSCITYAWCLVLALPIPNSEVQPAPADLHETCSLASILDSTDDRAACKDACDVASCCGSDNETENCFLTDPLGCVDYAQCGLLLLTGGDVPLPPETISSACSWETISSGPNAGEDCAAICEESLCCWEDGEENCYGDGNFFACSQYLICSHLLFEGGSVESPPEDLADVCAWSNLDTEEGFNQCRAACSDGFCCVNRTEEGNCFVGKFLTGN